MSKRFLILLSQYGPSMLVKKREGRKQREGEEDKRGRREWRKWAGKERHKYTACISAHLNLC